MAAASRPERPSPDDAEATTEAATGPVPVGKSSTPSEGGSSSGSGFDQGLETMAPGDGGASTVRPNADPKELRKFVRTVDELELFAEGTLAGLLETLPAEALPADAVTLADELVRAGRLTSYQAAAIFQGKARGLRVGRYVVLDKLGQGGMGKVFKARDSQLRRVVALKLLPPSSCQVPKLVQRFRREAAAAARVAHPNVVAALDADEARGVHFLVMEFADGTDLSRLIKRSGPLPVRRAVELVIQAARGLAAIHECGIVHRDIKPSNLLLDRDGVVKVLDLGIARLDGPLDPLATTEDGLTSTGAMLGTADYMSPEQAYDSKHADHRADIYSLGCTLHYLFTGASPFPGDTIMQRLLGHRERPVPSLAEARPEVPPALDALFRRMLAKDPAERPQSMAEVIALLEASLSVEAFDVPAARESGPSPPPAPPTLPQVSIVRTEDRPADDSRPPRPVHRRPLLIAAGVAALAGIATFAMTVHRSRREQSTPLADAGRSMIAVTEAASRDLGDVDIETDAPEVPVLFRRADRTLHTVVPTQGTHVRLPSGRYDVALGEGSAGLALASDPTIAVLAGRVARIRIVRDRREPMPPAARTAAPTRTARVVPLPAEARPDLALAEQAEELRRSAAMRKATGNLEGALEQLMEAERLLARALKNRPAVYSHRVSLGDARTEAFEVLLALKRPADAAEVVRRDRVIWSWDPERLYRCARALARCVSPLVGSRSAPDRGLGRRAAEGAVDTLEEAAAVGFRDTAAIASEHDFDPIRQRADFRRVMKRLATGGFDGTIKEVGQLKSSGNPLVEGAAVTADGRTVVTVATEPAPRTWDLETGTQGPPLMPLGKRLMWVILTPDERRAPAADDDGDILLWDLGRVFRARRLGRHEGTTRGLDVFPDGLRAISVGYDGTAHVWDLDAGRELVGSPRFPAALCRVALLPGARSALLTGMDGTIWLWDVDGEAEPVLFGRHRGFVWSVAISPDGTRALTGSADRTIALWDLRERRLVRRFFGATDEVRAAVFLPDGRHALVGCQRRGLVLFDLEAGRVVARGDLKVGTGAIVVLPGGQRALSTHFDGLVRIWQLPTPSP